MTITRLELRGLTAIEEADFDFASGINVFIGENGTGKTHVLKAMYSILRAIRGDPVGRQGMAHHIKTRLAAVFRPDNGQVGRLVRHGIGA